MDKVTQVKTQFRLKLSERLSYNDISQLIQLIFCAVFFNIILLIF